MAEDKEHDFRYTVDLTSPEAGFDTVHSLLEQLWIDAPYVDTLNRSGFETALIELVSNVFQHGDSDITPLCTITVTVYSDHIECSLLDAGTPRELHLTGRSLPDEYAQAGRGIILIQALVDELSYTREGERNHWRMVKKTASPEVALDTVPQVLRSRPIDEATRQQALESLYILDTPPEDRFDMITRLTQRLFGVETCTISLIDNDRQWFKSRTGIDNAETSRSVAFCDYTIRQYDAMVVPDAREDPRFKNNSLVTGDPNIRFYAGYPLEIADHQAIGTLCVFDPNPRVLSDNEKGLLKDLAFLVQNELVASQDSQRAKEVQAGLLPNNVPNLHGYEFAGLCLPSQAVGGDFYDWFQVEDGVAITLADVMGKGTGAAIIAATVRAVLRSTSQKSDLGTAIRAAAATLEEDLSNSGKFVTLFYARLHTDTGLLEYVDAGHGLTTIIRANGVQELLSSEGLPLGLHRNEPWIVMTTSLEIGDTLISASDGTLDLYDGTINGLMEAALRAHQLSSAQAIADRLKEIAKPKSVPDDVTILVIRRIK